MTSGSEVVACSSSVAPVSDGFFRLAVTGTKPAERGGDSTSYERTELLSNDRLRLITAQWPVGSSSQLHGHGDSAAVYLVVSGCLDEERWLPQEGGWHYERSLLHAGDRSELPAGAYHQLRCVEAAVTLHAYLPGGQESVSAVPASIRTELERARRGETVRRPPRSSQRLAAIVEELLPAWADREALANKQQAVRLPAQTLAEIRSSGILAAPVPIRLGGWDTNLSETVQAIRRVAQQAPSTALALAMPLGNAATTRIPSSAIPAESRLELGAGQCWIAEQAVAGRILAVANSEPGSGGDLSNTTTVAVRQSDGSYHLTGRKSFATFGSDADFFLCAARTQNTAATGQARGGVDGFFVPVRVDGVEFSGSWHAAGMRPTASVGLTLTEAPAAAVLGYPGCLEGVNARHWSTVLFAAVFVGIGEGALREGQRHAPMGSDWARSQLADHALQLDAAAGLLESVARDERWPLPAEAQQRARSAKTFAALTAVETATRVAMISGGRSYSPEHPVFRFLCDALAGPLLRPPLPKAMDEIAARFMPSAAA